MQLFKAAQAALSIALLSIATSVWAFPVQVSEAPRNNLALTLTAIKSARKSLLINIYYMTDSEIAQTIEERIRAGVKVEILQEGQPVSGMSPAGRGIQAQLIAAMNESGNGSQFYEMTSLAASASKRRFRFNHAKYAVIDGNSVVIGSENYSPSGHPVEGTTGNRGWEVWLHNRATAQSFVHIFRADTETGFGDILKHVRTSSKQKYCHYLNFECQLSEEGIVSFGQLTGANPPFETLDAKKAELITSPETSYSGLLELIRSARSTLDVELLTFYLEWKNTGGISPLVKELINASERGVQVRILLNDDRVYLPPEYQDGARTDNLRTAAYLNAAARRGKLPLEARVADLKSMGVLKIHNKGMLIDGKKTLISSINWNENSVKNNRETAVAIESTAINAYYSDLFEKDWRATPPPLSDKRQFEYSQEVSKVTAPKEDPPKEIPNEPSPAFICPDSAFVKVQIGNLQPHQTTDESFMELSNAGFESELKRTSATDICMLVEQKPHSQRSAKTKKFLQIRRRKNGHWFVAFEGYTSKGKLYSLRFDVTKEDLMDLNGSFESIVNDASSTALRKLGSGKIDIRLE